MPVEPAINHQDKVRMDFMKNESLELQHGLVG